MERTDRQTGLPARLTRRKAFTLVELLVVIAIIGILFVVLISKVDFATEKSKATGVQTDFRSYQVAIETVARENAGLSVLVDADATGAEKYAELEKALNKNLDPKLHVEIDADGKISTEARDPWKEQYLGTYLAPDTDGTVKDRGAIVMYSKGSNLKLGTTAATENGIVNVTIESGKETEGADDYSISTIYTYVNGYGEIQTATKGFSSNQDDVAANVNNGSNVTPSVPGGSDPSDPADPDQDNSNNSDSIDANFNSLINMPAGLYNSNNQLIVDWATLVAPLEEGGYEMDVSMDYYAARYDGYGYSYNTYYGSPYCVLTDHEELQNATMLVISDSVTSIGARAFYNDVPIQSVILGKNVKSINHLAFYNENLCGDFYLPAGLTTYQNSCFSKDSDFDNVYIEDLIAWNNVEVQFVSNSSFTSNYLPFYTADKVYANGELITNLIIPEEITEINNYFLSGYKGLNSVTVHNNVTHIGDFAFSWCESLQSISLGDGLVEIGEGSFYKCQSLCELLTIPNNVTTIGHLAFRECTSLTNIDFGVGVEKIGVGAFADCSGLTGTLTIPNSVQTIGAGDDNIVYNYGAFSGCSQIEHVSLGDNIQSLGDYTFANCAKLQECVIPNGITEVGSYVFKYCTSLKSVTLPSSVVSIGTSAFSYCSSINAVYISDLEAWCEIDMQDQSSNPLYNAQQGRLYVNNVLVENLVLPNEITKIKRYAFTGIDLSGTVTIPNTVVSIEKYAFSDSSISGLLQIPDSVTTINESAFSGCSNITAVEIGTGISSIGWFAFFGCSNIESITINANVIPTINNPEFAGDGYIFVPATLVDTYKAATGWSEYESRIVAIGTDPSSPDLVYGNGWSAPVSVTLPAGLYSTGALAMYESGNISGAQALLLKTWDELIAEGLVDTNNNVVSSMDGELILPTSTMLSINVNSGSDTSHYLQTLCIVDGVANLTLNVTYWNSLDGYSGEYLTVYLPKSLVSVSMQFNFSLVNAIYYDGTMTELIDLLDAEPYDNSGYSDINENVFVAYSTCYFNNSGISGPDGNLWDPVPIYCSDGVIYIHPSWT